MKARGCGSGRRRLPVHSGFSFRPIASAGAAQERTHHAHTIVFGCDRSCRCHGRSGEHAGTCTKQRRSRNHRLPSTLRQGVTGGPASSSGFCLGATSSAMPIGAGRMRNGSGGKDKGSPRRRSRPNDTKQPRPRHRRTGFSFPELCAFQLDVDPVGVAAVVVVERREILVLRPVGCRISGIEVGQFSTALPIASRT